MKIGVSDTLRRQRIEEAVRLKQMGLTRDTVLKQLNSLADEKGWGIISARQLRRDFSSYYAENEVISSDEKIDQRWERESHIEEMEKIIEKMNLELREKNKNWKPFEKPALMRDLFDMKMKLAELQNWNYGRFNPLHKTELSTDRAKMDMGLKHLIKDHPARLALLTALDKLVAQLPKDGSEVDLELLHKSTYRNRTELRKGQAGVLASQIYTPEEEFIPSFAENLSNLEKLEKNREINEGKPAPVFSVDL